MSIIFKYLDFLFRNFDLNNKSKKIKNKFIILLNKVFVK